MAVTSITRAGNFMLAFERARLTAPLQWLAQLFQHITREFGELIQEQNAVVGKANFAWSSGPTASTDQAGVGNRVMRRTEGPPFQ